MSPQNPESMSNAKHLQKTHRKHQLFSTYQSHAGEHAMFCANLRISKPLKRPLTQLCCRGTSLPWLLWILSLQEPAKGLIAAVGVEPFFKPLGLMNPSWSLWIGHQSKQPLTSTIAQEVLTNSLVELSLNLTSVCGVKVKKTWVRLKCYGFNSEVAVADFIVFCNLCWEMVVCAETFKNTPRTSEQHQHINTSNEKT